MIKACFMPRGMGYPVWLDPCASIKFQGAQLVHPQHGPIAVRQHKGWETAHGRFIIIKVDSPVIVHLESEGRRSPDYGPFNALSIVDAWIFARPSHLGLAYYDDSANAWLEYSSGAAWEAVVFTSA